MKTVDYWSIIGIILVRGMVWAAILVTIESHNLVFFLTKFAFRGKCISICNTFFQQELFSFVKQASLFLLNFHIYFDYH